MSWNWWNVSTVDNINPVPWMHPAAVAYLETILRPDMVVIEHGSGNGTLWLLDRVKAVYSYEHDEKWRNTIFKFAKGRNVNIFLQSTPPEYGNADLLLIDGLGNMRPVWMSKAEFLVKPGGVIVLDNAEREQYQAARESLLRSCVKPLQIVGYTDYGKKCITEFYRLKGGESWI